MWFFIFVVSKHKQELKYYTKLFAVGDSDEIQANFATSLL